MGLKTLLVRRAWSEIRHSAFKVEATSFGWAPPKWVEYFEQRGLLGFCRWLAGKRFNLDEMARDLFLSSGFEPTSGVTTEFVIIKGRVFKDVNRKTSRIRERGRRLDLPNLEDACLLRKVLSDRDLKEMGLKGIIVMHQPLANHSLLGVDRYGWGHRLVIHTDQGERPWVRELGFAFVKCRNHRSSVV